MAFCSSCGNELENMNDRCERCGNVMYQEKVKPVQPDDGGFLWGLLGFCVPIVGLILYLIWKHERPNTALAAGKGAIAGFIISLILQILYFVLFFTVFPGLQ